MGTYCVPGTVLNTVHALLPPVVIEKNELSILRNPVSEARTQAPRKVVQVAGDRALVLVRPFALLTDTPNSTDPLF